VGRTLGTEWQNARKLLSERKSNIECSLEVCGLSRKKKSDKSTVQAKSNCTDEFNSGGKNPSENYTLFQGPFSSYTVGM